MGIALSEATLRLVDGKNYAVLATVNPDGSPQLRGQVSMTLDEGRRVDTELSWKYDGQDPGEDRVVVRLMVQKVTGYAA
jgi:hypothetical protein